MPEPVVIVDSDPEWPIVFERIVGPIRLALGERLAAVEHVGSTSVPGCAAKPIIDIDVVVRTEADRSSAIEQLHLLGYRHRGDLGVPGREAFYAPDGAPRQHLYLVCEGNQAHTNHLLWRNLLLSDPALVREYGELKFALAEEFGSDRDGYTEAKTGFIIQAFEKAGIPFRTDRS